MSDGMQLPELRFMHEMGTRGHYFRKIAMAGPSSPAYYECQCGAQADRFGAAIPEP